jgi:hypothetical protein
MPSRFLIMATRLATLALLPSQVGQESISTFIVFSSCWFQRVFLISVISVNQWLVFVFPITRDRPVTRFFLISVFSVNQW